MIMAGVAGLISIASCKHENFDERCAREAKEYTLKQCPQYIGKGKDLSLDSMVYSKTGDGDNVTDRTFTYYYTFSGVQDSMLNRMLKEVPDTARKRLGEFKASMLDALATSVQLKPYKDKGFNFEYVYHSEKKKGVVLQFKFTKADYKH